MTDTPYKTSSEAAAGVGNSRSELLNQREAAEFLRISVRTLERWRGEGRKINFVCVGRRRLYRLADLEDFIAAHTVDSTAEADTIT